MSKLRKNLDLIPRIALLALLLVWSAAGISYIVIRATETRKVPGQSLGVKELTEEAETHESPSAKVESRRLAQETLKQIGVEPDLALLLAVEAYTIASTPEARESLMLSLTSPYPESYLRGHRDEVMSVAFSPDGTLLASGSADGEVRLWDLERGRLVDLPNSSHGDTVRAVVFHPDGNVFASGATDGTIIFWDVRNRLPIGVPLRVHGDVFSLAYSPGGRLLASGRDFKVSLWNVSTREEVCPALVGHRGRVNSLAFEPNGNTLVSGSWRIFLWDVADCSLLGTPLSKHRGIITSLAFSPDGNVMASGSIFDHTAILWDFQRREPLGRPLFHGCGVSSLAFSPDGEVLASGCADGTISLWDMETRQRLRKPLKAHQDKTFRLTEPRFINDGLGTLRPERKPSEAFVRTVAFSPDGKILASGGADFDIILWRVSQDEPIPQDLELIRSACRRANRNLSRKEWNTYFPGEAYRKTCPGAPTHPDLVKIYDPSNQSR